MAVIYTWLMLVWSSIVLNCCTMSNYIYGVLHYNITIIGFLHKHISSIVQSCCSTWTTVEVYYKQYCINSDMYSILLQMKRGNERESQ